MSTPSAAPALLVRGGSVLTEAGFQRADVRTVQRHGTPRPADGADVLDADLPGQPPVEELGHQVGDRGAVQTGGVGDVGA